MKYGDGLFYYNRNVEVDFYVPEENLAVQSCYRLSDDITIEREVKALVALNSLHYLNKAMIITYEDEDIIERDGLRIEVIPVWKWVVDCGGIV